MSEKTFDNVKITSSFDVPETGGNLVSGETIGKHFGKIAKHMEIVKAELDKKADKSEIPTELPANGGNADTVNEHTVNADVPADAKFTDTTYELATSSTDGLMSVADKNKLDSNTCNIANKLVLSSYTTLTISTSNWTTNSSGGYVCTKTLSSAMAYTNFNIDVVLSSDQSAAKLQLESWNYVMADGRFSPNVLNGSTTAFTFEAFTTKPTVELTVGIQGVS